MVRVIRYAILVLCVGSVRLYSQSTFDFSPLNGTTAPTSSTVQQVISGTTLTVSAPGTGVNTQNQTIYTLVADHLAMISSLNPRLHLHSTSRSQSPPLIARIGTRVRSPEQPILLSPLIQDRRKPSASMVSTGSK